MPDKSAMITLIFATGIMSSLLAAFIIYIGSTAKDVGGGVKMS